MSLKVSQRLLIESQWLLRPPPTFLISRQTRAWLNSFASQTERDSIRPASAARSFSTTVSGLPSTYQSSEADTIPAISLSSHSNQARLHAHPNHRVAPELPKAHAGPVEISDNLRLMLPLLQSQKPHFISLHIHGKSYLVTAGDSIRLPFLMPDVSPGDILRLDCATVIGSRDYTLKSNVLVATPSSVHRDGAAINNREDNASMNEAQRARLDAKRKKRMGYLDDRLFVCRATVTGVESEPMRVTEKKKPRNRHTRHIFSKHKYTCLRISEIRVKSLEELEEGVGR